MKEKELEEALLNVPIKSIQTIQKYIEENYIPKKELNSHILQFLGANIYYSLDKRELELRKCNLKKLFNVDEVILRR